MNIANELIKIASLITSKINIKGRGRGKDVGAQVWNDIITRDGGLGRLIGLLFRHEKELDLKKKGSAGSQTGVYFDWFASTANKELMQDILKKAGWKEKGKSWEFKGTPFDLYVNDKHALGSLIFSLSDDYSYVYDSKNKSWSVYDKSFKKIY